MNLVNILLDKQFKLTLLENNKTDNIIFCKPFEDTLHNLCSYTTRSDDFIYRYVLENGERFIITDILLENGTLYKKVKFKLVTTNEEQVPYSVINLKSLTPSDQVLMPVPTRPTILQEQIKEPVVIPAARRITAKETPQYNAQEDITKVKLLEQELLKERTRLENEKKSLNKQKLLVDNQNTIQSTIESFKEELIQEFHNISQRQESMFQGEVSSNVAKLQEKNEKMQNTLDAAVKQMQVDTLYKLKETIKNNIQERKLELQALIESKSGDYIIKVVEKADELKSLFDEKLAIDLQQYKEKLIIEFISVNKKQTQEFLDEGKAQTQKEIKSHIKAEQDSLQKDFDQNVQDLKAILEKATKQIDSRVPYVEGKIELVQEKINELNEESNLLKEARENILQDSKKYTDTKVNQAAEEAKTYARRILELGGGGGSVAAQYANGGTMNGDLNVNANYLSGGVNLLDIFALQPDLDIQTLTYNDANYDLSISSGNTVNLSAINTTFNANSGKYESVYSTTQSNSARWSEAYTNLVSNSAAYLSAVNISLLAAASASWNNNYTTVSQNSAYWADTRNNVTFGQNVTINGNLSALGTSTFKNTIFTTTSALSVVNIGTGPALYVYQAAGPYDVASFYDGDGVEVLHVGNANAGQGGKVGINVSFPAAELTVNGAISANKEITVSGGNSNQWNSNYTTTKSNSANWSIAYTNLTSNSAAYLSAVDISLLAAASGAWNSNYTTTQSNSANWSTAYTNLVSNSAAYLSGASVSYVNTTFVKLSGDVMTGGLSTVALSTNDIFGASNQSVFTDGSSLAGNGTGTLTLNYANGIFTTNNMTAALFQDTLGRSSTQWNSSYTTTQSNSARWSEAYTNLTSNSAAYLSAVNISLLAAASGAWNSNYTSFNSNSARYDSNWTTTNANSASWSNGGDASTTLNSYSANWNSNWTTTNTNSANWSNWSSVSASYALGSQYVKLSGDTMHGGLSTVALSTNDIYGASSQTVFTDGSSLAGNGTGTLTLNYANGIFTTNNVTAALFQDTLGRNSTQWNSNYTTTNANSANWSAAYTNLVSNSANYLSGASVSYVNTNFVKLSGDTMTGGLSTMGLSAGNIYSSGTIAVGLDNRPTTLLTVVSGLSAISPDNAFGTTIHSSNDGGINRMVMDSFGGKYAVYTGRAARGTSISPAAVQKQDLLAQFTARGRAATGYPNASNARMNMYAGENFTDTAHGTYITFDVTTAGATVATTIAQLSSSGLTIFGQLSAEKIIAPGGTSDNWNAAYAYASTFPLLTALKISGIALGSVSFTNAFVVPTGKIFIATGLTVVFDSGTSFVNAIAGTIRLTRNNSTNSTNRIMADLNIGIATYANNTMLRRSSINDNNVAAQAGETVQIAVPTATTAYTATVLIEGVLY